VRLEFIFDSPGEQHNGSFDPLRKSLESPETNMTLSRLEYTKRDREELVSHLIDIKIAETAAFSHKMA
jgi:hypothetical protein